MARSNWPSAGVGDPTIDEDAAAMGSEPQRLVVILDGALGLALVDVGVAATAQGDRPVLRRLPVGVDDGRAACHPLVVGEGVVLVQAPRPLLLQVLRPGGAGERQHPEHDTKPVPHDISRRAGARLSARRREQPAEQREACRDLRHRRPAHCAVCHPGPPILPAAIRSAETACHAATTPGASTEGRTRRRVAPGDRIARSTWHATGR